ncbi:hypothetical protein HN51_036029 [Arachis hypogaea]|uniref:CLAVATA3/ESR (CLE)-related protein n=1 Tax=Arachis hypogaea TaxID=3818 RepID=A0A445A201_ARAHY|nr:hypothetical protein Ahy_B03g065544 [Arachis hypogaea]
MGMIIRFQHVLTFILWISLLLMIVFFLGWFGFNSNNNGDTFFITNSAHSRKMLATTTRFNFSPFLHHQRHHRHRHHHHHHRSHMTEAEIDPRYGVDKRLVPTGPNPLHH